MYKKVLAAMALASGIVSAHASVLLSQNFDSVPGLTSSGWVITNNSTPGTLVQPWVQGDSTILTARSGSAESYIAANYGIAADGGTLDAWLITPTFSTENAVTISFWVLGANDAGYSDHFSYGVSTGSSDVGDFIMSAIITANVDGWTQYTLDLAGLGAGSVGRFAIQYSGEASLSNYLGVDDFSVSSADVPEPATWALVGISLLGLGIARRRAQR